MVRIKLTALLAAMAVAVGSSQAISDPREGEDAFAGKDPLDRIVWEYGLNQFSAAGYAAGVAALVREFEAERGYPIRPGRHRRVGLKVYTNSGAGISTPVGLVRGVVRVLEERGYRRGELFLIDLNENRLRDSGFLPSRADRNLDFEGIPVYALESGRFYRDAWFYDNPLPADRAQDQAQRTGQLFSFDEAESLLQRRDATDRKSFLAVPLLLEVDFWINLPMVMDHPATGISGALANPTLWNISNNRRFFNNPATAPAATAEIAAIPELREGWIFTLMTLERYQYIGGPRFHSLYTRSEPRLLLSSNPVALDFALLDRINRARRENGFGMLMQEQPLFYYAETLGLGTFDMEEIDWRVLGVEHGEDEYTDFTQ